MSKRAYKTYSKEFKVEAVRLAEESDQPVTQAVQGVQGVRVLEPLEPLDLISNSAIEKPVWLEANAIRACIL